jgi:hypothetical protein
MPAKVTDVKDQDVLLWDHTVTPLSRFWEHGPLVLVFLRHYG